MKSLEKLVSKTVKNVTAVKGGNSDPYTKDVTVRADNDIQVQGFEASADLSGAN